MDYNAVIPEFIVSNLEQSRSFYCDLLGFTIEYERPEENFLFLSLEDCQLMLEEGTKDELVELTYPFGRGVNISFGIKDVPQLHQKLLEANYPIYRPLTKREFRVGEQYIYPHEFAVFRPRWLFFKI
ncbi:glyoxalase family protein superfamily [Streptococcus infantis SK1302]|uniref:Bleomycin resistance protein n=1 Tax=Streptococcus infantis SK1302 TaxID=871237 RepID=A0ABN0B6Z8_9STRE|nr:glyoxalase family protein superfamily [Streptococcus infantis SK1302]